MTHRLLLLGTLLSARAGERLRALKDDMGVDRPSLMPILIALIWSVLLILPVHVFDGTHPYLDGLQRIGPEWRWGILTLSVAGTQIVTFLFGRYWQRMIAEVLAIGVWGAFAILIWQYGDIWHGVSVAPGTWIYFLLAASCFKSFWVLKNFTIVDKMAHEKRVSLWVNELAVGACKWAHLAGRQT